MEACGGLRVRLEVSRGVRAELRLPRLVNIVERSCTRKYYDSDLYSQYLHKRMYLHRDFATVDASNLYFKAASSIFQPSLTRESRVSAQSCDRY